MEEKQTHRSIYGLITKHIHAFTHMCMELIVSLYTLSLSPRLTGWQTEGSWRAKLCKVKGTLEGFLILSDLRTWEHAGITDFPVIFHISIRHTRGTSRGTGPHTWNDATQPQRSDATESGLRRNMWNLTLYEKKDLMQTLVSQYPTFHITHTLCHLFNLLKPKCLSGEHFWFLLAIWDK